MVWTPVIHGQTVETPHGLGTVERVSETQKTARVNVNGQQFEVPLESIQNVEAPAKEKPAVKKQQPLRPWNVKAGDRVQTKDGAMTGEVKEVTQRTVKVQFDNGVKQNFEKKRIQSALEREQEGQPEQQPQEETKAETKEQETKQPESKAEDAADTLYNLMRLQEHLEKRIDTSVDGELKELRELAKSKQTLEIKIEDKVSEVEGLKHKQLEQLITYAAMRLSPLLVGMAGTGKTHAGEQTAKALNLPFYSMSVGAQTSKSDIIGYMSAGGQYVSTHFRTAYETGGVFLMDEIDAGNANVLIQVNAALSNGLCAFPDAMVARHPDFVFIASANTYGNGANRQYVGRNQLDAATLDRFAVIDWLIDDELESNLTVGLNGKAWYMAVRAARDFVAERKIRALVSPRATQKGSRLLDVGQPLEEVIDATLLASVPEDKRADVKEVATKIFEKFASDVPKELPVEVDPPMVADLVR